MLIKIAILRGIIPLIIMTIISIIMKYQGIDPFQVRGTFIVGIIIASVAAASVIYEIENWSLFKQSVIHFLIMLVTVLPLLYISGWYKLNSVLDYVKVFGIFLFVGIVLWTISYFIFGKTLTK
ncbi:TPA: DUF3021 family protein [Streptococcus agalactiae]|jgi:hypothetical protein|uniref:DUF3021 domain-containing protein n=2 Tax=Bacillota TaxID=1239 RepID=A0A329P5X6_9LACT|nr:MULTISPECIES: DUF3021 family protein [Bacillota]MBS6721288.1 DUF3021 family protein [Peptoniphilus harei]CRH94290.1 Protein of uncharacterised function (DUF3021) [Chlamydia trachomatis]HAP2842169.1 DUF3021 domain-containing protein [Enterococcus faecalis]HEN2502563.1 DUF3021 family protein [Streptococcus agalactiae]MBK1469253.1 DUF3021 family protein [Parvimonas parva]